MLGMSLPLLFLLKVKDSHYIPAMQRPRFKLSTLLMLTAAIAALMGYSQVRRHRLNREFAALKARGCPASFQDSWFWPPVPAAMGVTFRIDANERYTLAAESLTSDEAWGEFESLRDKLYELGVENVWMQAIRN